MPVLVTGAENALGDAAVTEFLSSGGQVRVYLDAERSGDAEAQAFRRRGCKVAVGLMDDEAHLETALTQVHTVAHLAGGPLHDPDVQLDMLATVTSAALGAGCRRLLWISELATVEHQDGNPYLRMLETATDLVNGLPMETVALRCALRYGAGDALTQALAGGGLSGSGANPDAPHAPVFIPDVAGALAVADRQRGSAGDLHLDLQLRGPTQVSLAAFVRQLGGPPLDGPAPPTARLPAHVAEWLSRPATGDETAVGRLGTSLDEGIARL